jgi:predicted hydrocarbon binding protein
MVVYVMENPVPKRVFTLLNKKPGEDIYEICITLKDVHGAVSKTAKVLSDSHVNLRTSILFDAVEESGVGYWTSFLDLSKAVNGIGQIEEALRKLDVVQDVRIAKPEPLAYDVIHFPITHGESTAMVMPLELFGSLFDEIQKILTPSGFAAVFYNAGKKSGSSMARLLSIKYGLRGESLISALIQATKAIGWGQIEDFDMNEKGLVGSVKVRMCFEALMRGHREEKVCHWSRGFVAGFLSQVVGKNVEAVETKCIATGDEICEFEVKPRI